MKLLRGTPLLGRLLALPAEIRLGCKGLPGTNTIAYLAYSQVKKITMITGKTLKKILTDTDDVSISSICP